MSSDFRLVGLLNPLDCPHHLRADDFSVPYRFALQWNPDKRDGSGVGKFVSRIESAAYPADL